jgi:uncharacterized membrane protein YcaP (DUF421 family)
MLAAVYAFLNGLLGLDLQAHDLGFNHVAWRGFIVFCFGVLLARLADRRMLGHNAGFDIMLLVVLGSVLSRAINGAASFFPTLGVSALLVGLHHVVATIALRSHRFSQLVKGNPIVLVRDGVPDRNAMQRAKITADDLDENLRLNGSVEGTGDVGEARLERNGTISVVKAKPRDGG